MKSHHKVENSSLARNCVSNVALLPRVGADFEGVQLPLGIEPNMIQDLVKLIELHKHGVYPYEVCFDVHPAERGWFPYMISDACCLHSMMFSLRAFIEKTSKGKLSRIACFHYAQTLQTLRVRLNELPEEVDEQTVAISDATIMVVITLASAAEITGDFVAMENHMIGLERMVNLRGGVRALTLHHNIQVKVCRADLAYALIFGRRPCFLHNEISWDCFIANRNLVKGNDYQPFPSSSVQTQSFLLETLNFRLNNAFLDLHAFSSLTNLAYQTSRKISPATYNEMMISILYRLTHLSFPNSTNIDIMQEVIRLALLVFSTSLFMQRHFLAQPYKHLWDLYHKALASLKPELLPAPLVFWLHMLSHAITHDKTTISIGDPPTSRDAALTDAIFHSKTKTWLQARVILRSIAWVDFIHDGRGKAVFE